MPKVSVIIPCYRTQIDLLKRSVMSVLAQTFRDFELLIVDDGNTEEYRNCYNDDVFSDPRIKVYKKKNEGVSCARNYGVTKAEGEYIAFVDADDVVLENYLQEAVHIAEENRADLVIGGDIDITKVERIKASLSKPYPVILFENHKIRELNKYMLGKNLYWFQSGVTAIGQGPWTRLVKREIAINVPFDVNLPIGEDVVWNLELFLRCRRVCVAETVWYGYYYNPDSATRRYREKAVEESRSSLEKIKKYLDMNNDSEYYSFCSRCFVDLDRVYRCFIGNENNGFTRDEIKRIEKEVYTSEPWAEVKKYRYFRMCPLKDKISLLLYRYHLLFNYYSLRKMLKKGRNRA